MLDVYLNGLALINTHKRQQMLLAGFEQCLPPMLVRSLPVTFSRM